MGHRANFVVIRDSSAQAFYSHWGALGCLLLLEDGPEKGAARAEYEPTSELLEWFYAEDGYLIDFDQRLLLAFGTLIHGGDAEPSDEEKREAARRFLLKLAPKWPGWLLRWDDRGVDAFAEHLEQRAIKGICSQERRIADDAIILQHQA